MIQCFFSFYQQLNYLLIFINYSNTRAIAHLRSKDDLLWFIILTTDFRVLIGIN